MEKHARQIQLKGNGSSGSRLVHYLHQRLKMTEPRKKETKFGI